MNTTQKRVSTSPAIDCRLVMGFEEVRRKLLESDLSSGGEKPLGYWALPDDRYLPLVLMNRKLREVIGMDFDALYSTPGVGPKKLGALIALLHRATVPAPRCESEPLAANGVSAYSGMSEARWEQWRASVLGHGLERETFGRLAETLQELPRSLWRVTLETYARRSLAEIRQLKAHGEKRVLAIAEVFGQIHSIVSQLESRPHLSVRIKPRFVVRIESWAQRRLDDSTPLSNDDLCDGLVNPLLEQVANDLGDVAAQLALHRLPPHAASMQQIARRLGVTRGRVYELLSDVAAVIEVRWPEGRAFARRLVERVLGESRQSAAEQLAEAAMQTFFVPQAAVSAVVAMEYTDSLPLAVR